MFMVRIFFNMIKANNISIDDVPDKWKEQTQELIDADANKTAALNN